MTLFSHISHSKGHVNAFHRMLSQYAVSEYCPLSLLPGGRIRPAGGTTGTSSNSVKQSCPTAGVIVGQHNREWTKH